MKKLAALFLASGMVVAASAPANAVDVKVDYRQRVSFDVQSKGFQGKNCEDATMRSRLGLSFAASETLAGYIQFQTGKEAFGSYASNAGTAGQISVRQAYIDWIVPATPVKVRMGRQMIGLPAEAMGFNSVMDAGWGGRDGIVVTAPVTDWLGMTAFWARTQGGALGEDLDNNRSNDIFALVADTKFDAIDASVYAAYANLDTFTGFAEGGIGHSVLFDDPNEEDLHDFEGTGYWFGATATLKAFDPFTFALSFAYGHAESDGSWEDGFEQEGWVVQAKASYELGFGTPILAAWYGSGLDADDDKFGIMPSIGGYVAPTRSYHDNCSSLNGGQGYYLPSGNWGVQIGIEGMSFLKDLSHDFLVTYIQGTSDKNIGEMVGGYFEDSEGKLLIAVGELLTEDDSLVSFDFVSTYKIYKNLAAHLELAYIINDFDNEAYKDTYSDDDWRVALTFDFKF